MFNNSKIGSFFLAAVGQKFSRIFVKTGELAVSRTLVSTARETVFLSLVASFTHSNYTSLKVHGDISLK